MDSVALLSLVYLVASVMLIIGLKQMSHPRTAVRGIVIAAVGMAAAIFFTFFDKHIAGYQFIVIGLVAGSVIGTIMATKVEMTAMPQMVGLLNGLGGAASTLVALADLIQTAEHPADALIAIVFRGS